VWGEDGDVHYAMIIRFESKVGLDVGGDKRCYIGGNMDVSLPDRCPGLYFEFEFIGADCVVEDFLKENDVGGEGAEFC